MSWYAHKDTQDEHFSAYALTLNNTNFLATFNELENLYPHYYNIIVSLFDRDPISRLDNFDSGNVSVPNWNDNSVTLEARQYLRDWRCKSKSLSTLDFGEDCETLIAAPLPTPKTEILLDDYGY